MAYSVACSYIWLKCLIYDLYIKLKIYDLYDLFMIACFLLILFFFNPSTYNKLLGASLCISQVLCILIDFCFHVW